MDSSERMPEPLSTAWQQTTQAERSFDAWEVQAAEVGRIVVERRVATVFQPIRSLADGTVFGYEALSRGPAGPFNSPTALFAAAERSGLLLPLERLCRESAVRRAASFSSDLKLFLNIDPRVVNLRDFHPGVTRQLLDSVGRSASSLVLEITERHSIEDFRSFRRALRHYTRQGYNVAIDDLGSGYSSLQAIVELKPGFLKIDMSLVRGVGRSRSKQVLIEALTTVARRLGLRTVAEGIETAAELAAVRALGVDYGQGYLLGRPAELPQGREEIKCGLG